MVWGKGVGNFGGGEIRERKERNHQKGVSSTLLSLSFLGKHAYRVKEYQLGLKQLLLGHWVGFERFFYCKKFHTPQKHVNWGSDSKIHPIPWAWHHICVCVIFIFGWSWENKKKNLWENRWFSKPLKVKAENCSIYLFSLFLPKLDES